MTSIAIIDCGIGNLRSVQKAFEKAGAEAVITRQEADIRSADALVLPGVGAFARAMEQLHENDVTTVLCEEVSQAGKPILGICLGMQLLARNSEEGGPVKGLGLIPADVRKLDVSGHLDWAGRSLPLPHMGWNSVRAKGPSRLFEGIEPDSDFYFVHSYHLVCDDPAMIAATCSYGDDFACALEFENIYAAQFHPEKSQKNGARLIENYLQICGRTAKAA